GPCRAHVFLHEHRGEREHVADVVEAIARIIGGKFICRAGGDAQQVVDGVVVFGAVQPARGDAARIGRRRGSGGGGRRVRRSPTVQRFNPPCDGCNIGGRWLRKVARRHGARLQLVENLGPHVPLLEGKGRVLEPFQAQTGG